MVTLKSICLLPISLVLFCCQPTYNLVDFNASGQGDITTTGSINEDATSLTVTEDETWVEGYGIRILRAGEDFLVHNADSGWESIDLDAQVLHDPVDKQEGVASVACTFLGESTDLVDLCGVVLSEEGISFLSDDLRFWIKSSIFMNAGDLELQVHTLVDGNYEPRLELDIPLLEADQWTEVFVKLESRRSITGLGFLMTLRCKTQCSGLTVHLDDFWLVNDLIAHVTDIEDLGDGGVVFQLDGEAGRTVVDETVYHDDTTAVVTWLGAAGEHTDVAKFVASPGVYYMNVVQLPGAGFPEGSYSAPIYNDTLISCEDSQTTVFKNTGRSATGPMTMFRGAAEVPEDITIENCGFDFNGWNWQDFSNIIALTGSQGVKDITLRDNNFFDSVFNADRESAMEDCDLGLGDCATRQRHYILLLWDVEDLLIENNTLSGGGRIKAGDPGLNMVIRNNQLDFVNDNGITIVQSEGRCNSFPEDCVTTNVEITDNIILNPVTTGILFGADGEVSDHPDMGLRDITIARNTIQGDFKSGAIAGILPGGEAEGISILDNSVQFIPQRPLAISAYPAGLILAHGDSTVAPATNILVQGNSIVASGEYAQFNNGGVRISSVVGMNNLRLIDNELLCDDCLSIDVGLWFIQGEYENVEIAGNIVDGATNALATGYTGRTLIMRNADISGNDFLNSTSLGGQISLYAEEDGMVEARIAENNIHGGAGWGILCDGGGEFLLTDLETNDFLDNALGDITGCPE